MLQKWRMQGKKKVYLARVLLSLILLSFVCPCFQPVDTFAEDTESKTIKVGFFKFAGYHDIDEYGNKSGYGYDFIQMMARYDNNEYEFVGYENGWNEMLGMLDNGEVDLLTNVAKTAAREEKYLFSAKTIGNDGSLFTVRDNNASVVAGDYSTYDGLTIGSIQDSVQVEEFAAFAEEKGFSYTMQVYATDEEMEQALLRDEIDGIISIGLRNLQNEKVIEQINKSDMYVICRKEDTELMAMVNRAIDRLDQERANWRSEIFDKYYHADQGDNISFLTDELAYIEKLKAENYVMKVAVNPDRRPYSYYENGTIVGIIPRIFEEVAKRIGIDYEIQVVQTREEYQALLKSGTIDACLDEIYAVSEADDVGFKLTEPYLSASIARVVHTSFDGEINTIAVLKYADLGRAQLERLYADVELVEYDTIDQCIEAVKNGKVDATYVYSYAAQIALNEDPENIIRMNIMMDYGNAFAIAVPKTLDYEMVSILNKGVNSMEQEYIQNIITDETDYQVESVSLVAYLRHNPLIVIALVIILFLVILTTILLLVRIRYVNRLKVEEENKNRILQEKAEQESELVQAMTYVCKTNEIVRNINLQDRTYVDYYLEDGQLKTREAKYIGYAKENYNETFYPEDYAQIVSRLDEERVVAYSTHGGGEEYFECRAKNAAGEYRWYGYTLQAIPVDPIHPCNFIVYKKDIHEAKLKEIKARQNLEDALKTAQHASAAKGQFMSRMSHEIRTPLNAVLGYMRMAREAKDNEEKVQHCIENSEIAANHLLNIINDVLDISAIESGKIQIARVRFNLKEFMTSLQTVFSNQAESKQLHFELHMEDIKEEWVMGDSLRLNQILMNLLSNAMKFTEVNGYVILSVKAMKHSTDKTVYQFQVCDNGVGMSEEFQSRLYGTFEQESASTAMKYGGSGLGLSIAKNLITMMNGSIDVKSKEGEGTAFTVVLELENAGTQVQEEVLFAKQRVLVVENHEETILLMKKAMKNYGLKVEFIENVEKAAKKIQMRKASDYMYDLCVVDSDLSDLSVESLKEKLQMPVELLVRPISQSVLYNVLVKYFGSGKAAESQTGKQLDVSNMHVLLAEDNEMNMEIATDILTKVGMIVTGVGNGQEALEEFEKSAEGQYQAILMDIQMPVMDGYEATKKIRRSSHGQAKTIPIIAMTANAFTEDVSAAFSAGMNDHISKPIHVDKLYESLGRLISQ